MQRGNHNLVNKALVIDKSELKEVVSTPGYLMGMCLVETQKQRLNKGKRY